MKRQRDPLEFYNSTITESFLKGLLSAEGVVHRDGIFKAAIVIWLMISQRLNPNQSLARAIEVLRLMPSEPLLDRAGGSIRARSRRISGSTRGFAQARERLAIGVVEKVCDTLSQAIETQSCQSTRSRINAYVIDGSTLRISHSKKNVRAYPPTNNQFGTAHYPIIRIGVAMNVTTGVAVRPAYGPYNGPDACGELDLADQLLSRLPNSSVIIGDRYYGCFRFINKASQHGLDVVTRLKELNSKRFIGIPSTTSGEKQITWKPSYTECKRRSESTKNAAVKGKIIWFDVERKGFRKQRLILFSTLDLTPKQLAELYGLRWNVELDLRDIKKTLGLDFIRSRTPEMIGKELILATAAFNLIRYCMHTAAATLKVDPRSLSFARVRDRIDILGSMLLSDCSEVERNNSMNRALTDIRGLLLYQRKKRRPTEPRKVWPRGDKIYFSSSASRETERSALNPTRKQRNSSGSSST